MRCFSLFLIAMAANIAAETALAAQVLLQVDGRNFYDDTTNVFLTASSGIRLVAESGDWKRDANGTIYNAKGSGALPWRVEPSGAASGKYVKSMFVIVTNAPNIRLFETVAASGERFRMAGMDFNDLFNAEAIPDTGEHTAATWAVDLQPEATLSGGKKQLLEIVFNAPQKLEAMHFLGEGRPEFQRSWRGAVMEIILLDGIVTDPVREAIAHYARLRYGLTHLQAQSTPQGRAEASAMGLTFANRFSTLLLLK